MNNLDAHWSPFGQMIVCRKVVVGCVWWVSCAFASVLAQVAVPVEALPSTAPSAPTAAPAEAPVAPATATTPAKRLLRRILIVESAETLQGFAAPEGAGFVALSPPLSFLDQKDINRRLTGGENQPIDERLLAAMAQVIENFARQNEYPSASAVIPSQSIADGTVRVVLLLGKKGSLATSEWKIRNIRMEGNRWFSESLLREKLRIEKGEVLRFSDLDRALSWTNNNPYRRVQVRLDPVPTTGEADIIVAVQEANPLRFQFSYDNSGNKILGENRFIGAVSYANLWGQDHQVSYQLITSDKPNYFLGHGFDYRIPLRWRHYLQLSASYVRVQPEFLEGLFLQNGESLTTDLRYTVPVRGGDSPLEWQATLSFKESNNNLAYGGQQQYASKTDIFQFTTGFSTVRRDRLGAWALAASVTASPGGINSRNTDEAFHNARFGARAAYVYGTLSFQRLLKLAQGWDYIARGVFHLSGRNLLAGEELTIGGTATVRGYNENVFSGDRGFVLNNELMTPAWKKRLRWVPANRGPLETRFLGFFDAADVTEKRKFPTDVPHGPLASAGIGVRMNLTPHFTLIGDYGWQLTYLPYTPDATSRGHIKVTLAF